MLADTPIQASRAYCYTCFKAKVVCVCGGDPVRNRTQAIIIQHPREVRHALGTERLARLGLERCDVRIAWDCVVTREMIPEGAALLYPSAKAVELSDLPASERPAALVAIDGTWSQAKTLYRDNPVLAEMPHVKLTKAPPSNYRIRREPKDNYVSTLEALVHALKMLEPDTAGWDGLLERFARMIDQQIEYTERPPAGSYRHAKKAKRMLRPHPLFREGTLVAGYAEYVTYLVDGAERDALVQVCLERLSDGATREWFVKPDAYELVDDKRVAYMELERAQIAGGMSESQVHEELRAFVQPSDVLVTWNHPTMRVLEPLAGWRGAVSLKAAYANLTRSKPGHMLPIIEANGIAVAAKRHSGRAGERMAWLSAISKWMSER